MKAMIKKFSLVSLLVVFSAAVFALDLGAAKSQGLVGEKPDGYLAVVDGKATADAKKLVSDVNAKRKAQYQQLAQKNNLTLQQVESLAGEKAIKRTKVGNYIYLNGKWVQK